MATKIVWGWESQRSRTQIKSGRNWNTTTRSYCTRAAWTQAGGTVWYAMLLRMIGLEFGVKRDGIFGKRPVGALPARPFPGDRKLGSHRWRRTQGSGSLGGSVGRFVGRSSTRHVPLVITPSDESGGFKPPKRKREQSFPFWGASISSMGKRPTSFNGDTDRRHRPSTKPATQSRLENVVIQP